MSCPLAKWRLDYITAVSRAKAEKCKLTLNHKLITLLCTQEECTMQTRTGKKCTWIQIIEIYAKLTARAVLGF